MGENEIIEIFQNPQLRDDKEYILKNVKNMFAFLPLVSNRLKSDKDIIREAVRSSYYGLCFASESVKSNKAFVMELAEIDFKSLEFISKKLKDDKEFILPIIGKASCFLFEWLSDNLKQDLDIIAEAVIENCGILEHVPNHLLVQHSFMLSCIKRNGYSILGIPNNFIPTQEFLYEIKDILPKDDERISDKILELSIRLPEYSPTEIEFRNLLNHSCESIKDISNLRKDEWIAKMEENKLKNSI